MPEWEGGDAGPLVSQGSPVLPWEFACNGCEEGSGWGGPSALQPWAPTGPLSALTCAHFRLCLLQFVTTHHLFFRSPAPTEPSQPHLLSRLPPP